MGKPKQHLNHEPEAVTWARDQAGLTMTDVARQLGVSLSLISQIESGDRNATPAMIAASRKSSTAPRSSSNASDTRPSLRTPPSTEKNAGRCSTQRPEVPGAKRTP